MIGAVRYVRTPVGSPDPVNSPPIAAAPFYLPVYPTGSTVPDRFTLDCLNVPMENCPDHQRHAEPDLPLLCRVCGGL